MSTKSEEIAKEDEYFCYVAGYEISSRLGVVDIIQRQEHIELNYVQIPLLIKQLEAVYSVCKKEYGE